MLGADDGPRVEEGKEKSKQSSRSTSFFSGGSRKNRCASFDSKPALGDSRECAELNVCGAMYAERGFPRGTQSRGQQLAKAASPFCENSFFAVTLDR